MTPIYHITEIANLDRILSSGGLFCDNGIVAVGLTPICIGHKHIKQRRARRIVDKGMGGTVADYAPFYFAPRSPMLFSISKGNVEGFSGGQEQVVHLVSSAEAVVSSGLPFVFSDGHAEMAASEFYESLDDLKYVDWSIMKGRYWNDTDECPDRKRKRQAEFLIHKFAPWSLIEGIGVYSATQQQVVQKIVGSELAINVQREWYY